MSYEQSGVLYSNIHGSDVCIPDGQLRDYAFANAGNDADDADWHTETAPGRDVLPTTVIREKCWHRREPVEDRTTCQEKKKRSPDGGRFLIL
jgi:hypothetical protein